ncbi:hypothetical protein KKC06_06730 [Patescibacteria group bacterium]|nr:hypothetical protein [Patescibacteria group bacterium]
MIEFFGKLYYWLWHDFLCRLEPFTYEFRRHVAKWWLLDIIFFGVTTGVFLWMLLFPLAGISSSWRIAIIVIGACGMVFFAWLLLHLGHFASVIWKKLKGRLSAKGD